VARTAAAILPTVQIKTLRDDSCALGHLRELALECGREILVSAELGCSSSESLDSLARAPKSWID